jgi:CheY-like chemotaxis protein
MYKILIVEDNEINQKVLFAYLDKENIKLTLAKNGKEAVSHYNKSKFDCILMDIAMPEMDGIQATKKIRKQEISEKNKTPIIAVTASDPYYNRFLFKEAGFDDYVAKPVTPSNLIDKICRYSKIRF